MVFKRNPENFSDLGEGADHSILRVRITGF
jgi:hypothetical protein